ncbi:hypothetical protein M427DRAFT_266554 [Gonapodya prolifera JEL478]|uniref:Actin-like ATPase domain-containing protein n=1 Tax=Gonapodya prolifera (strain JEL478) TaxID=1344416 RepID=A0A138ZWS5_GONPJ|nr:hypothetical protein M427DRAFT_266554 [Gonapodya prolifera JEL478]|eukprot:KXS08947.1 hypothetical protein M427DRAFT_266554 [Gonapodya prolifera JEL478]
MTQVPDNRPVLVAIDLGAKTTSALMTSPEGETVEIARAWETACVGVVDPDKTGRIKLISTPKTIRVGHSPNQPLSVKALLPVKPTNDLVDYAFVGCPLKWQNNTLFVTVTATSITGDDVTQDFTVEQLLTPILERILEELRKTHPDVTSFHLVVTCPNDWDHRTRKRLRALYASVFGQLPKRLINEGSSALYNDLKTKPAAWSALLPNPSSTVLTSTVDIGASTANLSVSAVKRRQITVLATLTLKHGGNYMSQTLGANMENYVTNIVETKRQNDDANPGTDYDALLENVKSYNFFLAAENAKFAWSELAIDVYSLEIYGETYVLPRRLYDSVLTDVAEEIVANLETLCSQGGKRISQVERFVGIGGVFEGKAMRHAFDNVKKLRKKFIIGGDDSRIGVARGALRIAMDSMDNADVLIDTVAEPIGIGAYVSEKFKFVPIIPRGTPLPHTVESTFYNSEDNQPDVNVNFFYGNTTNLSRETRCGHMNVEIEPGPARTMELSVVLTITNSGTMKASVKTRRMETPATNTFDLGDPVGRRTTKADEIEAQNHYHDTLERDKPVEDAMTL